MINVCISEDDYRIADIHEELVSQVAGFQCVGKALNAADTISLLKRKSVDLVILDIYLPDELGAEMLPKMREQFPSVDVIIISASTENEHLHSALRYGTFDFIIKPVSLPRLKRTLERYRHYKETLLAQDSVTQERIDRLIGHVPPDSHPLPKGIDSLTLDKVRQLLQETPTGITAGEMGKRLGASRTTARRYLEYLISVNEAEAQPIYGVVGRPERRYFLRPRCTK